MFLGCDSDVFIYELEVFATTPYAVLPGRKTHACKQY